MSVVSPDFNSVCQNDIPNDNLGVKKLNHEDIEKFFIAPSKIQFFTKSHNFSNFRYFSVRFARNWQNEQGDWGNVTP